MRACQTVVFSTHLLHYQSPSYYSTNWDRLPGSNKAHIMGIYVLVHRTARSTTEILFHYTDVVMSTIASQITSLTIVYSSVYSSADQRKYQSSASLAFVQGIHRGPVNSPHKGPVTRKMFPFDDVIMQNETRMSLAFLTRNTNTCEVSLMRNSIKCHYH